jgi:hypothetical protein
MLNAKKHSKVLAVCDSKLIGRKLKENEMVLDLKAYSAFYGKGVSENTVKEWLIEASNNKHSINLVGSESVSLALSVLKIKSKPFSIENVPILQIYFI